MRQYATLLVMLVTLTNLATPMHPPAGKPIATWLRNGRADTEIVTSAVTALQEQGHIYYVATDGDDGNPGTEAQPFRTIDKGVSVLDPGDTLYVREGVYHEQVVLSRSGTADDPITVAAYPGESPIIDGQDTLPTSWGHLLRLDGDYDIVDGFEVRNSASLGVGVRGNRNELRNFNVHHSYEQGVHISGDYNLVDGCEVWWNSTMKEYGHGSGGWANGIAAGRSPSYTTIRNCVVYNNWGEGVSTFEADHTTIEDNVVYDNYGTNIYINNCPYALVRRNLAYHTGDSYFARAPGIAFCDESYDSKPARSHHVTIVNNLVMGTNRTFYFWQDHPDSGLKHFLIAHNTFVNSHNQVNFQITAGNHEDSRIENNIFVQDDDLPIAIVPNDPDNLSFSNNLWSKTPDSDANGPGDVIGDPQLTRSGSTGPGLLSPEWFKILASSPARDRAKTIGEVTEDFFKNARGDRPDIGAHEYLSGASPTKVTDLRVVAAVGNTPNLTVTLRWTAPVAAITYTLRSSDTLLTMDNWNDASIVTVPFTASEPGSSEWLTTPVDYTGGTLYLALKSQNSAGTWSELSNNAFWPYLDIYLPLIMRDYVSSSSS